MPQIKIESVKDGDPKSQPILAQMERRMEDVRRRAFELFELRGCEYGQEVEDWLKAEREVLGWPPLETKENEREFEFQVPLDDFQVSQVTVLVTPSEIVVHAKTEAEKQAEEANARAAAFTGTEIYRRIELPRPIETDRTTATFDKGTLRITAAKAETESGIASSAAA